MMRVRLLPNGKSDGAHKLRIDGLLPPERIARACKLLFGCGEEPSDPVIYDNDGDKIAAEDWGDGDELWLAVGGEAFVKPVVVTLAPLPPAAHEEPSFDDEGNTEVFPIGGDDAGGEEAAATPVAEPAPVAPPDAPPVAPPDAPPVAPPPPPWPRHVILEFLLEYRG